ncbi:TetR/AcrR family transcriptional regulator [Azospirillum sp. B4]|uniref:TetR/AcrR family transcriptional regulator n=1 Tax=Azospirillum sp. B4 TaxID=95605 RepID=UPI000344DD24|nr:TetR/AcrR family transcriptional regulator [Azospirillum sp. B4]
MDQPEKPPYHHGALRQALVAAALETVERMGHEALSFRDLTEAVGVSRTAPYRHFADRDALLAAVAVEGYSALMAAHHEMTRTEADPQARWRATARGFLDFARSRPELFRLMYETRLAADLEPHPDLAQAVRTVYDMTLSALRAAHPDLSPVAAEGRMVVAWSTLYGYAKIRNSGQLQGFMRSLLSEQAIEDEVVAAIAG